MSSKNSPAATERLRGLWEQVKEEKTRREIAVKEAEGWYIFKLGELLKDYILKNGVVSFMVHARLKAHEGNFGDLYRSLDHDFCCPFQLAYILAHITNTDHLTRQFTEKDFGVTSWEIGKSYQNICEVAMVDGDLAFRVLDREIV